MEDHFSRMSKAIADRPAKPGIEKQNLGAGDVVTLSRNLVTGDRSYAEYVWEVVASNGVQIALKALSGQRPPWLGDQPRILMIDEYEFYDGRPFVGVLS